MGCASSVEATGDSVLNTVKEYDVVFAFYEGTGKLLGAALQREIMALNPHVTVCPNFADVSWRVSNIKICKNFVILLTAQALEVDPLCQLGAQAAIQTNRNVILLWDEDKSSVPSASAIEKTPAPEEIRKLLDLRPLSFPVTESMQPSAALEIYRNLKDVPPPIVLTSALPPNPSVSPDQHQQQHVAPQPVEPVIVSLLPLVANENAEPQNQPPEIVQTRAPEVELIPAEPTNPDQTIGDRPLSERRTLEDRDVEGGRQEQKDEQSAESPKQYKKEKERKKKDDYRNDDGSEDEGRRRGEDRSEKEKRKDRRRNSREGERWSSGDEGEGGKKGSEKWRERRGSGDEGGYRSSGDERDYKNERRRSRD